jgi:hypothetical protein
MPVYTRKQLLQLHKNLPQELKDWIGSEETDDAIYRILRENELLDNKGGIVSALIRNVLFGLLPPAEFVPALEKEAGLDKDLAKKIGQEINRFVFFPVKELLAQLYQTGSATSPETKENPAIPKTQQREEIPEPPMTPEEPDTYREPIE